MYDIAANLKKARLERGLTREQVAEAIGYSKSAVQAWEEGVCPSVVAVASYAEFLGVSLDRLIGKEPEDGD